MHTCKNFCTLFQGSSAPMRNQLRASILDWDPGEGHCFWSLLSKISVQGMSTRKNKTNHRDPGYQRISPQSTESSVSEHRDILHREATNRISLPIGGAGTMSCDLGDLISPTLVFINGVEPDTFPVHSHISMTMKCTNERESKSLK